MSIKSRHVLFLLLDIRVNNTHRCVYLHWCTSEEKVISIKISIVIMNHRFDATERNCFTLLIHACTFDLLD